MTGHLRSEDIVAKAYAEAGVDDVGVTSFNEGLDLLVDGVNRHPGVTPAGRAALEGLYASHLVNRLKTEDHVRQHPEVLQAPVERPVFVFGMPRTGTTLLSYLLGVDPGLRPLLNWEAVDSVPPPTTATLRTDPRCVEKARQKAEMLAADPSRGRYHWEDADGPTECVFVHGQDFRSAFNEASLPDPAYSQWLSDGDMTPAYEYEKRLLQVLQSQAPGQWSLKAPSHALFLDALLEVFPDAVLLWIHRDPVPTVGSLCSLIRRNQSQYLESVDQEYIGRHYLAQLLQHVRRPAAVKDRLGEDRIHDVSYAALVRDPIGTVRRLYADMGQPLGEAAETGMQAWLADNPQGKHGTHSYGLEEFGLSEQQVRSEFADYVERFGVEVEK
jgi:hypothetical protein